MDLFKWFRKDKVLPQVSTQRAGLLTVGAHVIYMGFLCKIVEWDQKSVVMEVESGTAQFQGTYDKSCKGRIVTSGLDDFRSATEKEILEYNS